MNAQHIRDLISRNQWESIFSTLKNTTPDDEHWHDQVTQLESQYRHLRQQSINGVLTAEEEKTDMNRLRQSVLVLVNDLPDKAYNTSFFTPQRMKIAAIAVSPIALFVVLATVLGWFDLKNNGKPFTVVVYTHGKGGQQDILYLKETKLVMDIGGRREVAKVDEKGQNIFTEIPASFYGKKIGIGIENTEGYALTQPQTTYLLNGEPIYVAVSLSEQTRGLKGIVKDAETKALLDNVAVATLGESVLTDANGYFELKIPIEKEQDAYELTLSKQGYRITTGRYIPLSQVPEYRLEKN